MTVTDLEAAEFITNLASTTPPPSESYPETKEAQIPHALLQSTRSLNLSLYRDPEFYHALSLPFYDALSLPESVPGGLTAMVGAVFGLPYDYDTEAILQAVPQADLWRRFCAGLASLPRLVRLTVWLDNTHASWSDMDERAILTPLRDARKALPRLRLALHLPEIPKDEVRRGMYLPADAPPSVMVRRSNRRPTTTYGGMTRRLVYTLCRSRLRMYNVCEQVNVEEAL
ncbi:hypothetical protein IMZ48_30105 [Candidatus Bathyarchaeota archaeon]|nr:hypothetical protein [Candidatus Bathyarchaeota archaeon]